jgi:hypothetical protein
LRVVDIPKEAAASGECGSVSQTLVLQWLTSANKVTPTQDLKNVLKLIFEMKESGKYGIGQVQYSVGELHSNPTEAIIGNEGKISQNNIISR